MNQHLEPTYLRYIYDGLIKGSIHPENAAELPDGLIGMYEEAFDERTSVVERQKLLQRFAIWALLKKEVSAAFVAEILGETEDDIQDFISNYSAWFNSPESGKYQLYHERLKVYLLQKLSEGEVHMLHEKLIGRLEQAIEEQKADEFEWYGLEFLGVHLCVQARGNTALYSVKLLQLAENESFKTRQYLMSASFEWTYSTLDQIKSYFFSINDLDVSLRIEILFAEIFHKEKNSFSELLSFIEQENLNLFIKRFSALKGESKIEIENFFYLSIFMLDRICAFTFSSEKIKNQFLVATAKVLDDNIPNDIDQFDWERIISPNHVVKIIENLIEINLENILISRTRLNIDNWRVDEEKKKQAGLEKNRVKADILSETKDVNEKLPPLEIKNIKGKRKSVEAQIEYLKALWENNEIERSWELLEEIKIQLKTFPSFNFYFPYRISSLGITRIRTRNSCWYFGQVLDVIGFGTLPLEKFLNQLSFFRVLNPIKYKEYSSWYFHYYYLAQSELRSQNADQIFNGQDIVHVLEFVSDILNPEIAFKPEEPRFYDSLISTLIFYGEFNTALNFIEKLSIEFDFDDSTIINNAESWRVSIYSKWTFAFLEKGQFDHAINLLGKLSLPYFKDIIRKTLSSYYLTLGDIKNAVFWALEVSEDKSEFIKYLSSQISEMQFEVFIKCLLRFYPKNNFATSVIDLINIVDAGIIKLIRDESANFWSNVWFLLLLHQKGRIDDGTFKYTLKSLIDNIPANDIKVNFCVQLYGLLCVHKKEKGFDFLLKEIKNQKNIENINSDAPWGSKHHDLFKNIEHKILTAVDRYSPLNFWLKLKILSTIHTLNFYRPINSKSVINYFVKSIFKSFFRFFYYLIVSIRVLFFPQIFSKFKMNKSMKTVQKYLDQGDLELSIKEFLELEKFQIHPYSNGLEFFELLFSKIQSQEKMSDFAVICGYTNAWEHQKQKNFVLNFLGLDLKFQRNKAYFGNLNQLLNPSSISIEAVIKSSHFFEGNRNFRFATLYKYAVQVILTSGQSQQFEKMMNLDVYKKIYKAQQ